ncbi:hypothetical protein C4559_03370 [Candidatus Microgenomates bacterium]|nr:MAG: hypothetical protein C4559_03370 [Candidatus Microgenomates bacterium]
MRTFLLLISLISYLSFLTPNVFAQSNYVLPYPSSMPGSSTYRVHLLWDKMMQYWYFGDFGQFKYNLKQADKYLVEAKTLFEYKQYLLAVKALNKSDYYFKETNKYLIKARLDGKDTSVNDQLLKSAKEKHKEVLQDLTNIVPDQFLWQPEKDNSTKLNLKEIMNNSIKTKEI